MAQLIFKARATVGRLVQWALPDSLFGRLAWLLAAAVVASHVLALTLMFELNPLPHAPELPPFHDADISSPGWLPPPPPPIHQPLGQFHVGLLMDISVRLVALLLAAWIGARWLSVPVRRLADAARALGSDIHRPPIAESGTQECRQAIQVFNQMQQRLCTQLAQRDQFVAAVSHDLRTPLTRLSLRVQSLVDPGQRNDFARDIMEMDEMIRTTLDYLRGMADPEPVLLLDIGSLLQSLAEDAQDSGQDVQVQGDLAAAPVSAQAMALRRCVGNLIGNAVRYGHRARVSLSDSPQMLHIRVEDDGPGIADGELERVLMPFYRLESSRNRHSGGVGLGLATANDIAQKHGGRLVLSNHLGGGLLATLSLPR